MSSLRRLARRLGLVTVVLLCAAPTPGDIGGCGHPAADLDAEAFLREKYRVECDACRRCSLVGARCSQACAGEIDEPARFPEGCFPLAFDGAVCLRALEQAGCHDHQRYLNDVRPSMPSECDFCPETERP